jgi:hypothetical protein
LAYPIVFSDRPILVLSNFGPSNASLAFLHGESTGTHALGAPSAGFAAHAFKANVGMVPFTEIMIEFYDDMYVFL